MPLRSSWIDARPTGRSTGLPKSAVAGIEEPCATGGAWPRQERSSSAEPLRLALRFPSLLPRAGEDPSHGRKLTPIRCGPQAGCGGHAAGQTPLRPHAICKPHSTGLALLTTRGRWSSPTCHAESENSTVGVGIGLRRPARRVGPLSKRSGLPVHRNMLTSWSSCWLACGPLPHEDAIGGTDASRVSGRNVRTRTARGPPGHDAASPRVHSPSGSGQRPGPPERGDASIRTSRRHPTPLVMA